MEFETNVVIRKENMAAFLEVIDSKFSGAENYVTKELGLSKEDIEKIRSNLIVDA